jgi:transcriptional regulator GlxA family with amidase domain
MSGKRESQSFVSSGRLRINQSAFDDPRLIAVAKFVEQSIGECRRVSLAEAARVACLCPQRFSTLFRERVGICFSHWQSHFRTQQAKILLANKSWMQLGAVGRAVGYDDLSTFGRVFKRCERLAPHEFRWLTRKYPELRPTLVSTQLAAFVYSIVKISRSSADWPSLLLYFSDLVEKFGGQ